MKSPMLFVLLLVGVRGYGLGFELLKVFFYRVFSLYFSLSFMAFSRCYFSFLSSSCIAFEYISSILSYFTVTLQRSSSKCIRIPLSSSRSYSQIFNCSLMMLFSFLQSSYLSLYYLSSLETSLRSFYFQDFMFQRKCNQFLYLASFDIHYSSCIFFYMQNWSLKASLSIFQTNLSF